MDGAGRVPRSDSTAALTSIWRPTERPTTDWGGFGRLRPVRDSRSRTCSGVIGAPARRAAWITTAAAAATIGAEADVPPLRTGMTAFGGQSMLLQAWTSAGILSLGAVRLTRVPNPLEKLVQPL